MPLKIRVKPEGTVTIGDVVLKNVATRTCDLLILTPHKVLRAGYMQKNVEETNVKT